MKNKKLTKEQVNRKRRRAYREKKRKLKELQIREAKSHLLTTQPPDIL